MRVRAATYIAFVAVTLSLVVSVRALSDEPPTSVDPRDYTSCSPREAPPLERCAYVRQNPLCARDQNFLPYLDWHYCALHGDAFASGAGALILVIALFATLATTAERFFVPALQNVSAALRLSDDVAGATLLSFGNGAPDIFAQIAALRHRDAAESLALAVGAVTGAGTFIASFVFPCVILIGSGLTNRGEILLNKWAFGRDVGFYFVAASLACGFFFDGSVQAYEAAGLFGLYLIYLYALLAKRRVRRSWRRMVDFFEESPDESPFEWSDSDEEALQADDIRAPMIDEEAVEESRDEAAGDAGDDDVGVDGDDEEEEEDDDDDDSTTSDSRRRTLVQQVVHNLTYTFKKLKVPLVTVLRMTMPELRRGERTNMRYVVVLPIAAPLFLLFATGILPGSMTLSGVLYGLVVSVVCAFVIAQAWPHIADSTSMNALLTGLAFFQSVLWMNTAASEVVSLLSAIGKVSGVSEALLGATVLAWGNSVGDFVSNTVVAREGNPNMAIAACFAGPLMNLLVGTSFGLLLHIARYGPVTGYIMPNELVLLCGGLLFALGYAIIIIPFMHKWRVGKSAAYGMIGFYVVFSILYALTSVHSIFRKPWIGPPQ